MNDDAITLIDEPAQAARSTAVATTPQAGPMALAIQAMQAGMTVADMRGMLDLQKDWEANEARKAYVQAMSDFKAEPLEIFKRKSVGYKTKEGDFVGYKHAELSDVADVVVPAMARHGLTHRWELKQGDGRIVVSCTITHRLGHSESVTMDGAPDNSGKKNSIQQAASTITYLQRYTLLAATGLATKTADDDDGAGGGDGEEEINPKLLADARENALLGTAVFKKWFRERLNEDNRIALEPYSTELRAACKAADEAPK